MRASLLTLALASVALVSAHPRASQRRSDYSDGDVESGKALERLAVQAFQNAWNALPKEGACSRQNVQIRREFRATPPEERKAYTDALQCLQSKPSIVDQDLYPGAKTRYDDFVLVHVNFSSSIHQTANFLTWHRYYVWAIHQSLINECEYTGQMPFWEWGIDAASDRPLRESPIFNGDPYSMGSDGTFLANNTEKTFAFSDNTSFTVEAGTGGGPTFSGPFSNYTVNLGPYIIPGVEPSPSIFAYHPRPFTRSLRRAVAQEQSRFANYTPILLNAKTPFDFQTLLDGDARNPANVIPRREILRPHGGGHMIMGGDPADDVFVSPGDPAFWIHHSQIDRLYWIWQNLDVEQMEYRASNIPNLTRTLGNNPPSELGQLSDVLDLDVLGKGEVVTNEMALKTTGGDPFCYLYL